jgi:hypothetical protein
VGFATRLKVPSLSPAGKTVASVAWVVLAAFAYLAPALAHGTSLGTQDLLGVFGLGATPGVIPHNALASDQIEEMIPWAALSWTQVHSGHFPLWNPYSGFGMPLLGNFVSASFSLPMLISYLGPERYVYTIETVAKMLIAGTGVLWMCRRLGLQHLPSVFAATTFMLSGAFTGWLGWPMSGTTAWLGWAIGATILIVRGPEHRTLHMAGLALVLAFIVYAGHPETLVIIVISTALVAIFAMFDLVVRTRRPTAFLRPLLTLLGAAVGGLALSAPVLLPGAQVIGRAARSGVLGYPLPAKTSLNLLFASYSGLPQHGSQYFGAVDYYETAAYVGAVALALAVVGLVVWRSNLTVIGFAAAGLLCAALTYSAHVSRILDSISVTRSLQWTRAVTVLDFFLAVLAAFGLQALLTRGSARTTKLTLAVMSVLLLGVVVGLFIHHVAAHIPEPANGIQARSFIWVSVCVVVLLGAAVLLVLPTSSSPKGPGRISRLVAAAAALVAAQSAFLLTATPNIWSSSNSFLPLTTAEATLQRDVGQARVGFAACPSVLAWPDLGILAETNDAYGLSEATAYDGTVPKSYFSAYFDELREPVPADTGFGQFCPSMTTANVARHFGVGYVLAQEGSLVPQGDVIVGTIAGEDLYRVPGGGLVTMEPSGSPADNAGAKVLSNSSDNPAQIKFRVVTPTSSTLYIHVTDFPGWTATIDGKPLKLRTWGGTMLAASMPAGRHAIDIAYRPKAFTLGLILAGAAAAILVATSGFAVLRRHKGRVSVATGDRSLSPIATVTQ